jgi:amidase
MTKMKAYSAIANVLDYTSGSFPVTFADASLDAKEADYQPCNWADQLVWQSCKKSFSDAYDL